MALQLSICSLLSMFTILASSKLFGHAREQVPCYFIFGDSLVDNGNNNGLSTAAKANYFPYGVDYPLGPTGRFSNGRNLADFIAEYLGFNQSIPPNAYAKATGPARLKGVNYGSGAAGIRDETGQQLGDRISLDRQLQNHKHTVSLIGALLRRNATNYLKTCLYSVGIGSNDYINNYFMPKNYNTSNRYTPIEYATALTQQYSQQLRTLYDYGARKIAVFGVGLLGCIPFEMDASGCSTKDNTESQLFDRMLPLLVDSLNKNLTDAKFTFVNVTHIQLTPTANTGISVMSPCCVVSTTVAAGQCQPKTNPCENRATYAFYDDYHPSERAAEIEARRAYNALTKSDAIPYDIKTLAQLQLKDSSS